MHDCSMMALSVVCLLLSACGENDASAPHQAPSVSIITPLDGQSFTQGTLITFHGTATDPEDGTLSGTALLWRSSVDGQFGTGETAATDSLTANTHAITLVGTDSDGNTSSDQITIVVGSTGLPDIDVSPTSLTMTTQAGGSSTATLTVRNVGNAALNVISISDDRVWLSETPTVVTLAAGDDTAVTVTAEAAGLNTGSYEGTIAISSNDPDESTVTAGVTLTVSGSGTTLIEMIPIDAGVFQMGSDYYGAGSDELPVHSVTVSEFFMAKYEVTQEQYHEVIGMNPSNFTGSNLPVEQVTWWDAAAFCNTLSEREGLAKFYNDDDLSSQSSTIRMSWDANGYRLPTEAEWEYACRASASTEYYWGDAVDGRYCWYSGNSDNRTHDVGTRLPNDWGVYDLSGNVWEWCNDWCDTYSSGPQVDPTGPATGMARVVRGGSWSYSPECCRSAFRGSFPPSDRFVYLGFRVVKR